jgi:alcohol dehydrogenase class IV
MEAFEFPGLPSRVVFGAGALARLPEEFDRLGVTRALVACTRGQRALAEDAARRLGSRAAGIFDRAALHVPVEIAHEARRAAEADGADCCVAIGGGSTIGLAKAIALTSSLPIVAIPTTYAGSELTPIYGLTEGGVKKIGRDARVMPRTVIYDPALTMGVPARIAAASGMNAIAHAVEALYAQDANPLTSLMAEDSLRALSASLPAVVIDPRDMAARSEALYGAWLAGACLGMVGMAIHHKLCHTLGGAFSLPHAEMHAILLPHSAAYNRDAASEALGRAARAIHASDAPDGLFDLARKLGLPAGLKDIGMPEQGLEFAARLAVENPYYNPRPAELAPVLGLLRRAWCGERPQ